MPTLIFRGTSMRGLHIMPVEGGAIMRLKFTADYTDVLREQVKGTEKKPGLDWEALPDSATSMGLAGELTGVDNFILTPNGGMQKNEIDVPAIWAGKFSVSRVQTKGDATEDKISFEIKVNDGTTVLKLYSFMHTVGTQEGSLKLKYKQQEVIDDAGEKNDRQLTIIDTPEEVKRRTNPKAN